MTPTPAMYLIWLSRLLATLAGLAQKLEPREVARFGRDLARRTLEPLEIPPELLRILRDIETLPASKSSELAEVLQRNAREYGVRAGIEADAEGLDVEKFLQLTMKG